MLGWGVVFYVIVFSAMAVLLVVAGVTMQSRNRRRLSTERERPAASHAHRRQRKAERAQSRDARRKRG